MKHLISFMNKYVFIFLLIPFFSSCEQLALYGFFYATTATSQPTAMEVSSPPSKASEPLPLKDDITILASNKTIYAYSGNNITKGNVCTKTSLENLIKNKKAIAGDRLKIFIKTDEKTDYKSTVDILDQMTANNIKKYFLSEMNTEQKNFIKHLR